MGEEKVLGDFFFQGMIDGWNSKFILDVDLLKVDLWQAIPSDLPHIHS